MEIVKQRKKNEASKSTPVATFNVTLHDPFLRGEDLHCVYQDTLIISSLHRSLEVSGNNQPGLFISVNRHVNPIIKDPDSSQELSTKKASQHQVVKISHGNFTKGASTSEV